MIHALFFIGVVGLLTSTVYTLLAVWGALRFSSGRRRELARDFHPPVSLLKPLHGLEADLAAHLESFFEQDYPSFEILFCARNECDPGLDVARRVAARYPHVPVKFLSSGDSPYPNAKVWSLERMRKAAEHEILVISDSDVSVTPRYLRAVVAPFSNHRVGLVTCLYRGIGEGSFWSRLEGVGMSVEMSAGVLVAKMLDGMRFALGPTMAVRHDCVKDFGGFQVLGAYHADDFILGNLVAASGKKVVLSTHVIDHHILNTSLLASVRHQIRWMKSTRFSRPKGHLGTALTFGMPYALLAAAAALFWHRPFLAVFLAALGWATRFGLALLIGGVVVEESSLVRNALLYPPRDLLGFFYWAASYLSTEVQWRGEIYRLVDGGTMRHHPADIKSEAVLTT